MPDAELPLYSNHSVSAAPAKLSMRGPPSVFKKKMTNHDKSFVICKPVDIPKPVSPRQRGSFPICITLVVLSRSL